MKASFLGQGSRTLLGFRGVLHVGFSFWLVSCGSRPIPAPPPAPRTESGEAFIAPDLEVVVRLDLQQVRDALGPEHFEQLSRAGAEKLRGKEGEAAPPAEHFAEDLQLRSLVVANVVWLGLRPGAGGAPTDRVLALDGRFEALPATLPGFRKPTDLGGDLRFWDRERRVARTETTRLYAAAENVLAFVSEAEIDAVERQLDQGQTGRGLRVQARGTLAFAARSDLLARRLGGQGLASLLASDGQISANATLEADALAFELTAELVDEEAAVRLVPAIDEVIRRRFEGSALAGIAKVEAEGARLTVRGRLPRSKFGALLACLPGGASASCPW